jgi:hypothetical protein
MKLQGNYPPIAQNCTYMVSENRSWQFNVLQIERKNNNKKKKLSKTINLQTLFGRLNYDTMVYELILA